MRLPDFKWKNAGGNRFAAVVWNSGVCYIALHVPFVHQKGVDVAARVAVVVLNALRHAHYYVTGTKLETKQVIVAGDMNVDTKELVQHLEKILEDDQECPLALVEVHAKDSGTFLNGVNRHVQSADCVLLFDIGKQPKRQKGIVQDLDF